MGCLLCVGAYLTHSNFCPPFPWSGGLKFEINIPSQQIAAKRKQGFINEGGVTSSEYGITPILQYAL